MTVGERIKARRKELGMSVDELAEKLGKNRATVYRYERNDIESLPANILRNLAFALETTPEILLGWYEDLVHTSNEKDNQINKLLPLLTNGVTLAGDRQKYVVFKSDAKGGDLEWYLKSLLIDLHQINLKDHLSAMKTLRVLSSMIVFLDDTSMEHLVSYCDYLYARHMRESSNTFVSENPYY